MTNTITVDQLKELLQIQKDFDSRIPTRNLNDTVAALVIEFVEWVNTLEFFKNWKKEPGKDIDTQLDEISDFLAFSLQLALILFEDEELDEVSEVMVGQLEEADGTPKLKSVSFVHVLNMITDQFIKGIDESVIGVISMPFLYAKTYYSTDQLITAYKQKMERNHARQDGTADKDKGYV